MIGFGTKTNTSKETIQMAIDNGYSFIDTKDSNQSIFFFKDLSIDRKKVFLCSKLMGESNPNNHRPENVIQECFKSLHNAGIHYWDLYYIHTCHSFDNIPLLSTYESLIELKKLKRILNTGLSNVTYEQLETILENSVKPDYIQVEIHPYLVEKRLVDFCLQNDIRVIAHSPLGSSLWSEISQEKILIDLSEKYDKTVSQIILQWHISRGIFPIPSSNNIDHLKNNLELNFSITKDELNSITNLNKNRRVFIKPNHYEKIGPIVSPPFKRSRSIKNPNNEILQEISEKGFFIGNLKDHPLFSDHHLYHLCSAIENELKDQDQGQDQKCISFNYARPHEIELKTENSDHYISEIYNDPFLKNLFSNYFEKDYTFKGFIKKSFSLPNLNPCQTALYHRDLQINSLKIIIYLNEVNQNNGPLKIIYPENEETTNQMLWYNEGRNKRTTEDQISQFYSTENKICVEGLPYTIVLFDGNILHSGGFIKKGDRKVIYIEIVSQ